MDDYQNEIITRCAPRWAWEIIDDLLALEACNSSGELAQSALSAMIDACEKPDKETISKPTVRAIPRDRWGR
jgi:hypothetical protein